MLSDIFTREIPWGPYTVRNLRDRLEGEKEPGSTKKSSSPQMAPPISIRCLCVFVNHMQQ